MQKTLWYFIVTALTLCGQSHIQPAGLVHQTRIDAMRIKDQPDTLLDE